MVSIFSTMVNYLLYNTKCNKLKLTVIRVLCLTTIVCSLSRFMVLKVMISQLPCCFHMHTRVIFHEPWEIQGAYLETLTSITMHPSLFQLKLTTSPFLYRLINFVFTLLSVEYSTQGITSSQVIR